MRIGILCAMEEELAAVRAELGEGQSVPLEGVHALQFAAGDHEVYLLRTKIGKVSAAYAATIFIRALRPDAVITAGIAGGIGVRLGDVVLGSGTLQHDVDVTPFGYKQAQIPEFDRIFKTDPELLEKALRAFDKDEVKNGLIASGDQFLTDPAALKRLDSDIRAVDMESAAVAQVCELTGTPFLPVRTISDLPGEPDQLDFHENSLEAALEKLGEAVQKVLSSL